MLRPLAIAVIGALCISVLLSLIGAVMVYSATRVAQLDAGLDPKYYLKRQLLWLAMGLVVMVVVALAIPTFLKLYPQFLKPKPETRPEGFPDGQGGWPLYFATQAFVNNRAFGMWFMLGLILDVILRLVFPLFRI